MLTNLLSNWPMMISYSARHGAKQVGLVKPPLSEQARNLTKVESKAYKLAVSSITPMSIIYSILL